MAENPAGSDGGDAEFGKGSDAASDKADDIVDADFEEVDTPKKTLRVRLDDYKSLL